MLKLFTLNNFIILKLINQKTKIIYSKNLLHINIGKVIFNNNKNIKPGSKIMFNKLYSKFNFFSKKYVYIKYKQIICIIK
ncbi:hypothetical protein [Candidatus Vidania fulgoroideorum]